MNRLGRLTGSKLFILGMLFLVTIVGTFISMNFEKMQPTATTMSAASLPTVSMVTEEGIEYNRIFGYTESIDTSYVYGNLTLVSMTRKLPIVIHTYGTEIKAVSYKIRAFSDNSLIENTQVNDYEQNDDKITATFNIKNLIDDNTEYLLEVILETDKYEDVHYYTRIITGQDYKIDEKIDFVRDFNDCTFDESRWKEISGYLESNQYGDNTNYGSVNINSSLKQVGWGDLDVSVQSEIIPTLIDVVEDVSIICLNYRVGAKNSYESYDSYNVEEYYRIRKTNNGFYLLNFQRHVNQIFDGKNDLTSAGKLNLGINATTNVNAKTDEEGIFTYFVNNGSLWCFNTSSQTYTKVFSFESEDSDNVREGLINHDIKMINIEENGDIFFVVYGYMNRGEHEGKVGVSLCKYSYANNDVTEMLFIPVRVPYDILKDNVAGVAYVSGDKFYILMDETLFAVDLVSKEIMTEIDGLVDGMYVVSENSDAIAYSTNGLIYDTDTIRILNMNNNTEYEVHAQDGDCLKPLGYIKSDFIYGTAHKSDILIEENGKQTFPMYKLGIIDVDYNLIKEYEQPDIYVSSTNVEDMRLTLTRIVKSEDGYSSTSIDQLINKDENQVAGEIEKETISTEARKQELYLNLRTSISDLAVTYRTSGKIIFKNDTTLNLSENYQWSGSFYVYGYGSYDGSNEVLEKAIDKGYADCGVVLDDNYNLVWKRFKRSKAAIDGISSSGCDEDETLMESLSIICNYLGSNIDVQGDMSNGKNAVEILNQISGVRGVSISNTAVEKVLYFVGESIPVIAKIGQDSYGIITGYDSKTITYLDTENGQSYTLQNADANRLFAGYGNVFITYYKGK